MRPPALEEAPRRTYLLDDLDAWDDALYQAARDFEASYGLYPAHATVHPDTLARFGARADPERLRDEDGEPPTADDLEEPPWLGEFATDDFVLALDEDPRLWPVELVLWSAPEGQPMPDADTAPPSPLAGGTTDPRRPMVVRPAHTRLLMLAEQCYTCRNLVTARTCRAFPAGIPLPIAASRHDHRRPFPGDGDTRYERSTDDGLIARAVRAVLFGDASRALLPSDAPDPAPPLCEAELIGDDRAAPDRLTRDETRARARARLRDLLDESGGPHACTADELCGRLTASYPVTRGMLARNERGPPYEWKRYVGQWHRAQLRRVRRRGE